MILHKGKWPSAVCAVLALLLGLPGVGSGSSWPTEEYAREVAVEVKTLVTLATSIIVDLQPAINQSTLTNVQPDELTARLENVYRQTTGSRLSLSSSGLKGDVRRAFLGSFRTVIERFQQTMVTGGYGAFVPATFRSQLLAEMNHQLKGRVKGYATNRDRDLINPDWSIDALMDYSLFAYYVQELLEEQQSEPKISKVAGRVVGYFPMTLKEGCVACHAKHGLDQQVGDYGGAFFVEVFLRD